VIGRGLPYSDETSDCSSEVGLTKYQKFIKKNRNFEKGTPRVVESKKRGHFSDENGDPEKKRWSVKSVGTKRRTETRGSACSICRKRKGGNKHGSECEGRDKIRGAEIILRHYIQMAGQEG